MMIFLILHGSREREAIAHPGEQCHLCHRTLGTVQIRLKTDFQAPSVTGRNIFSGLPPLASGVTGEEPDFRARSARDFLIL